MAPALTDAEAAALAGVHGEGMAIAMRLVVEAARILGAPRLVPIASAHIDGCLYHGDSGTHFAERLAAAGARAAVPTTLNIGAIDLLNPMSVRLSKDERRMALRLMRAYEVLGCRATFTCAPYQAGHRPRAGTDVAWGESNAVAFCNGVLGARTNRYGDFLDIACAIAGRAPCCGLHLPENRRARLLVDAAALPEALKADDTLWPVLGALVGRFAGETVAAVDGLGAYATEDRLKAFGAAAAAFGAVAHFHIVGATPEAPTLAAAFAGARPEETRRLDAGDIADGFALLSTAAPDEAVTAVGIRSPHLSAAEIRTLADRIDGRRLTLPLYANTGRHVLSAIEACGTRAKLDRAGVTLIADTCIVATPIIAGEGVLMTNSGKFANYAPGNIGHKVVFASLADCVETAVSGARTAAPVP